MRKAKVVAHCRTCHDGVSSVTHVVDCADCGTAHPAVGTLTGNWLMRWMRSHRDPVGSVELL